jgi:hypothetical protein
VNRRTRRAFKTKSTLNASEADINRAITNGELG